MHRKNIIKSGNKKFTKFFKNIEANKHKIENEIIKYEKLLNFIKIKFINKYIKKRIIKKNLFKNLFL